MKTIIFGRWRAERFHQLLDDTPGGGRRRSRADRPAPPDAGLADLLALAHRTAEVSLPVELDHDFRSGLRALLVATAEREGIGATAQHVDETPAATSHRRRLAPRLTRTQARVTALAGITLGAVVLSGISAASDSAVPGDTLYGIKRTTERASIALTTSDTERGHRHLTWARTRVSEALAVSQDHTSFDRVMFDMENDIRQGVRLLATAAVNDREPEPLDAIETFAAGQRLALGPMMGRLDKINQDRALWTLELLERVTQRAQALRTSMSCGVVSAGSDAYGPRPRSCTADAPAEPEPVVPRQNRPKQPTRTAAPSTPAPAEAPAARNESGPADKAPASPDKRPAEGSTAPAPGVTLTDLQPTDG
ncbi:DUF5667 domain-containing protein [Pilimelia columellifera]|uniref:DUF5667 domain-containing protein n=1 Tax=Pilimelia columellifera TaxID=706574 RepID=UPI0031DC7E74